LGGLEGGGASFWDFHKPQVRPGVERGGQEGGLPKLPLHSNQDQGGFSAQHHLPLRQAVWDSRD
jgi:hypothetical protein